MSQIHRDLIGRIRKNRMAEISNPVALQRVTKEIASGRSGWAYEAATNTGRYTA